MMFNGSTNTANFVFFSIFFIVYLRFRVTFLSIKLFTSFVLVARDVEQMVQNKLHIKDIFTTKLKKICIGHISCPLAIRFFCFMRYEERENTFPLA